MNLINHTILIRHNHWSVSNMKKNINDYFKQLQQNKNQKTF
ncbi:MAG: hypothetical protein Rsou_0146 [Candidatus Ruthia sp. Asou_11_S2]|nr:hypothetical protein [Candidatus Ruthia sp. Asou_11_S2]